MFDLLDHFLLNIFVTLFARGSSNKTSTRPLLVSG